MNKPNVKQLERIKRVAKVVNGGNLAIVEHIFDLEDKVESAVTEAKSAVTPLVEVLKQIKGETGDNGFDGKDGKNGIDGKDGRDGKDGVNGINGKDGLQGEKGADGLDGRDGKDGEDGKDGNDGSPDTGGMIVYKINTEDTGLIKKEKIEGLEDIYRLTKLNSFNPTIGVSKTEVVALDRRITTLEKNPGGSSSLTATEVGFGDGSNNLTGSANFTYDNTKQALRIGRFSTATGSESFSLGIYSDATGAGSLAGGLGGNGGNENVASGDGSFAWGNDAKATNYTAFAVGHTSHASGDKSFTIGDNVAAHNVNSWAIGDNSIVSGDNSGSVGSNNIISGDLSFALGNNMSTTAGDSILIGSNFGQNLADSILMGINNPSVKIIDSNVVLGDPFNNGNSMQFTVSDSAQTATFDTGDGGVVTTVTINGVGIMNGATTSGVALSIGSLGAPVQGEMRIYENVNGSYTRFYIGADDGFFIIDPTNSSVPYLGIGIGYPGALLHVFGTANVDSDFRSGGLGSFAGTISASNFKDNGSSIGIGQGVFPTNAGTQNIAIGTNSMIAVTSGQDNTAIGTLSMHSLVSGSGNFALGTYALYGADSNSQGNIAIGYDAMGGNSMGTMNRNLAIGTSALNYNTTGSNNVAIGQGAGGNDGTVNVHNTTGSNNTWIGYEAGPNAVGLSNSIAIGNGAVVTGSNLIQLGNSSVTGILTSAKITQYNGISTVSNGIPSELATEDLTGQTAAKTATTLYTPAATGMFRISVYLQITTAASTSSILGGSTGVVLTYKDGDGNVAQTDTLALMTTAGAIAITSATNTTATNLAGSIVIYAKTGVAIQYAIGYTSVGVTPMAYAAHLKVEAL